MILDSALEVKLYTKESVEIPPIVKNRFPKIQSVFQPKNLQEMHQMLSQLGKNKTVIIPRGAATSGMGGITPLKKSIMLDLTNLNGIIDLDEEKKTICVESGMRWWELKNFLKRHSLDLYTYPTSLFSTVGGWLSTGGYGINGFQYGHISGLVKSIEVATPRTTKWIDCNDREFKYLIGTEGQTGIISKVKLKVRESKPSKSYLVLFKSVLEASDFLQDLSKSSKILPTHISFMDKNRIEHKSLMLNGNVSFPRMETVLIAFENTSSEGEFFDLIKEKEGTLGEDYLTAFLWNERFFPFSLRHFHASVLGSEIILPIENLNHYIAKIRQIGNNYGISLSTEATLINKEEAVVFAIFPSDPKNISHFLHLSLTYSLSYIALKHGGRPYGIGIWNLPLRKKHYTKREILKYEKAKKEWDPLNIMNPGKSLSSHLRIKSLLRLAYLTSSLFSVGSSLFKPFSKIANHYHSPDQKGIPETEACVNCGACVAVCPAYLMTKTELVTAKGKLFLMKQLLNGVSLPKTAAEKIFLCLHCHLCEYVCQSKLELNPVWDRLESLIEKKFGRPQEKIDEFTNQVESHPSYTQLVDSFSFAKDNNHRNEENV